MAGPVAELADAQALDKAQLLARIESVTLDFLRAVEKGDDPELHLVLSKILIANLSTCPSRLYALEVT